MNASKSNVREEWALAREVSSTTTETLETSCRLDRSRVNHVAAEGGDYE